MKAKMIRLAVVLALLVSLFAIAAPPVAADVPGPLTPAYGDVAYTPTTPIDIQVGDTIQISGTAGANSWPLANVALTVKWYEADDATKPSVVVATVPVIPMTETVTDGCIANDCAYSFSFKVPPSVAGDHKIRVTDGINNADFAITVVPELKRTPSSGVKGTEVTITANGFSKATGLIVYDDTDDDGDIGSGTLSSKASLVTDNFGTVVGTLTGNGDYTFVARDGKGVEYGTTAVPSTLTFALKAKLTLTPTEGLPDTRVTIKGSQFTASDTVDFASGLTWGGTALNALTPAQQLQTSTGGDYTSDIPTGSTGAFEFHALGGVTSTVTFKIPVAAVDGLYTVTVTDDSGKSASATFNVLARPLTLSKTEGAKGTKLLVSGTGMTKNGTIAIGDLLIGTTALNTVAIDIDSAGSFSYEVTIPGGTGSGANTIKATDGGGRTAKATFTRTSPTVTLTPDNQVKGGDVVVTGSGYAPNKSGQITGEAIKNSPVTFNTDSAGNFQRLITVDTDAGSSNSVKVEDAAPYLNSKTVTLKVPSASLELSSTSIRPGDQITAIGTSLDGNSAVGIYANAALTGNLLATTVYTDSQGNFTATFTIPNLAEGFAVIRANTGGVGGTTGSRSVEVLKKLETTSVAMASISNQVTIVWGFDAATQAWMKYDPAAPAVSDLDKLEKGKGYWINVSEAVSLVYGLGTYSLSAGWNLIGWLGS